MFEGRSDPDKVKALELALRMGRIMDAGETVDLARTFEKYLTEVPAVVSSVTSAFSAPADGTVSLHNASDYGSDYGSDFGSALRALRGGRRVRVQAWADETAFLKFHPTDHGGWIDFHGAGFVVPWCPDQWSVLQKDWVVLREDEAAT